VTAKAIASLDALSGGRFVFGIGAGWNVDEMENHGATYKTRFAIQREHVLAMKEIWTKDEAAYHGKYVNFDPIWSWPKPHRKSGPPIILGGESDYTLKRVVEYCDGWFPRPRQGFTGALAVERLKKMAEEKGRDFRSLTITVFGAPPEPAVLAEYQKANIQDALLGIPDGTRDEILAHLDKMAPLARAHA
jgi:alkanesulfonate monooxygenase SsuD/methylene tetrahydromethanopterin reductase-like flavin-dependent oxidoreductase (luciferase family)